MLMTGGQLVNYTPEVRTIDIRSLRLVLVFNKIFPLILLKQIIYMTLRLVLVFYKILPLTLKTNNI
jgi:hypothetical protein